MTLILLRHGEAEALRTTDAERALTPRGVQQAQASARWIAGVLGAGTVLVVHSPYRRARETADSVVRVLLAADVAAAAEGVPLSRAVCREEVTTIAPDYCARDALAALSAAYERQCASTPLAGVIVVTHMPVVASLSALLESGVVSAGHGFSVAEARVFEWDAHSAELVLVAGSAREIQRFCPME